MSVPYKPQKSNIKFYVPPTLESDFDNFLENDIPNTVMDFEILEDWYMKSEYGYEPRYIRGLIYPDPSKSRYANTDNNLNFRASASSGIKKGDMVIDPSGNTYLFDWNVLYQHNNAPTRALRCNAKITVSRYMNEKVDSRGYLVREGGLENIAESMPCNAYRYDGRPEWSVNAGSVGLEPNALCIISMQYNSRTKNIDIDDEFKWGNSVYSVIDLNYMGCDMDMQHGVFTIQAKKKTGGES